MALQKYGDAEHANVFHGRDASIVNVHMQRHGKAVSEFSEDEKAALYAELERAALEEEENERVARGAHPGLDTDPRPDDNREPVKSDELETESPTPRRSSKTRTKSKESE